MKRTQPFSSVASSSAIQHQDEDFLVPYSTEDAPR